MIRLTLLLVAGIALAFAVAGRDPNRPADRDRPGGIAVTRLDTAPVEAAIAPRDDESRQRDAVSIPLDNRKAALQAALRASEHGRAAASAPAAPAVATTPAAPAPDQWYVTGRRVNLREGPSTATAVIGQVSLGQKALVLEETATGWFRIEIAGNGATGFIFGDFLSPDAPL